ncbi:MAG: hypothetical protein EOO24_03065 [Comamonadaceae bacterium]|nr:MAG: hypothetical protein EOO24_03065 [Comamonadaceae bacterium]
MSEKVKYVVSIEGQLLNFDEQRQPAPQLPSGTNTAQKPELQLIPQRELPASAPEWDEALARFSGEQRAAAQISVVVDE